MIKIITERPLKDESINGTDVTLISGMAGICSVGLIAVDAIMAHFHASLVGRIYLDDLPAQVVIDGKGRMGLPVVQIYLAKPTPDRSFLLVRGEHQPATNAGMYTFIDALMNYLIHDQGVRISSIISIGAYVVEQVPVEPKVFVSGTDDATIARFFGIDKGLMRLMEDGLISGANGLIPAWGTVLGLPGICLLSETVPVVKRDPRAAKLVIEVLSKYFDFPFDFSVLSKEIKEVEAIFAELRRNSRNAGDIMEQNARKDRQSYIG